MVEEGKIAYFRKDKGSYKPIKKAYNFKSDPWDKVALLWGDYVWVIEIKNGIAKVSAMGHIFEIPIKDLMDKPILHIYQIDCGQGDSTLINFPNDRWMLIDGGPGRDWSNTGKIAIDFLYWKVFVDFSWRREFNTTDKPFKIDSLVCTHPDYDHFGGLIELSKKINPDGVSGITIGTIFHNGLCRFSGPYSKYNGTNGFCQLGEIEGNELPDAYITTLIDGFNDVKKYLNTTSKRKWKLTGKYKDWLKNLLDLKGNGVDKLLRVHYDQEYLEGFEPDPNNPNSISIKVLGPIEETYKRKSTIRYLDTKSTVSQPSKTRNGHSVVLRLDYKNVKILFTGDLNFKSQALLFKYVPAQEFNCNVVKACHHGSEDISWKFLQAMDPTAVMISSGDNENYAHPRAKVLGWSGAFAHKEVSGRDKKFLDHKETNYTSPLIYSTELSRSVKIWDIYRVLDKDGNKISKAKIQARGRTRAGSEAPKEYYEWLLAENLIYGMINVRTDGEKVLMGVLKEDESGFQTERFKV